MSKEKLSKILMRIFYVIFALVVSVALWVFVELTENEVQPGEVSGIVIIFRNEDLLFDRGFSMVPVTENLSVRFEASRSDISRLALPGALSVEVDLATISSAGLTELAYEIIWPAGVNPNSINNQVWSDARVAVMVDRAHERQIEVRVDYTGGTASDDFVAEPVEFDPRFITVRGPEQVVSGIQYIWVPIPRESLATTYTDDLAFILIDDNDEVMDEELRSQLEFSQETVRVTVPIREIREVPLIVFLSHGVSTSDENTTWSVVPSAIRISGDPERLKDINNIPLGTINMLGVTSINSYTESFRIVIPDSITNVSGETEATVHVEIMGLDIKFISTSNLQVINPPSAYTAEILTQSLDVRLRGVREELDEVTPRNIRVVADLANQSSGTVRIPARVYIDGIDANIDPVGEYFITVTIVAN